MSVQTRNRRKLATKKPILCDRTNIPCPVNDGRFPRKDLKSHQTKKRITDDIVNQDAPFSKKEAHFEEMEVDTVPRREEVKWFLDFSKDSEERDEDKVIYVSYYARSIFKYLRFYEGKFNLTPEFMDRHTNMTPRMRYILVDWLSKIHTKFELSLDSFHLTIRILDRYINLAKSVNKHNLQLIGTTAFLIATKVEEVYPPTISDLSYMTENCVTCEEIRNTEVDMLETLNFEVNIPYPLQFYRRLSHTCKLNEIKHCMGKYLLELCLMESTLCHYRPSMLAAASVWLVRLMMCDGHEHSPWTSNLEIDSTYRESDLLPLVSTLACSLLRHNQPSKYRAIRDKYASSANRHVSTMPCIFSVSVMKIAQCS